MNDIFTVTLKDVYLPEGNLKINGIRLRKFQEDLYIELDNHDNICLQAPTGSGKTFSILIMLAKLALKGYPLPVVAIYPSRVLVHNQGERVREALQNAGFVDEGDGKFSGKIEVEESDGKRMNTNKKINVTVVELTSEEKKKKEKGEKSALDILEEYQPFTPNYLILLTVPEYPYIYLSHLKNAGFYFGKIIEYATKGVISIKSENVIKAKAREVFNQFSRYFNGYFFIDEFHLYSGLARASLFTLKRMIDDYNSASRKEEKPKFIFSSATPSQIQCEKIITAETANNGGKIRKRTKLIFHLNNKNPQQSLVDYVSSTQLDKKTMIILDRVYYIAQLCQKVEAGLVWGLNISYYLCKKVSKDLEKWKTIIGNNAVSFGIDIPDLDLGFIHAHDAESAIQRIGRYGRHGDGESEVHVFLGAGNYIVEALKETGNREISFEEYLNLIERIYKKREDDGLDKISFVQQRSEIVFNTYAILKGISKSQIKIEDGKLYKVEGKELIKPLGIDLNLRSSADEFFKVFAFRAGGLKGEWCDEKNGQEEERNLFTMLRNFRYDVDRNCFTKEPLKQNPEVVVESLPKESFIPYEKFHDKAIPIIKINKEGSISLGKISGIEDSYVIVIHKMPEWKKFDEMARLVSTYESALPACLDKNFDYRNNNCRKIDALLLFI